MHSRRPGTLPEVPHRREPERVLRDVRLRVTRPPLPVLAAVHTHPRADTDSRLEAVLEDLPSVSHEVV